VPLVLLQSRVLVALAAAAVAAPTILFVARVQDLSDVRADALVAYASGYDTDLRVAGWIRRHTGARDTIYVLSRADIYFLSNREAPFPYLWSHPLHSIPGALSQLERPLAGRGRPRLVIEYQHPNRRIAQILRDDYFVVWRDPTTRLPIWKSRSVRATSRSLAARASLRRRSLRRRRKPERRVGDRRERPTATRAVVARSRSYRIASNPWEAAAKNSVPGS
jgi:hypothetical protein